MDRSLAPTATEFLQSILCLECACAQLGLCAGAIVNHAIMSKTSARHENAGSHIHRRLVSHCPNNVGQGPNNNGFLRALKKQIAGHNYSVCAGVVSSASAARRNSTRIHAVCARAMPSLTLVCQGSYALFTTIVLVVALRAPGLFTRMHGRRHRVVGAVYLVLLCVGIGLLFTPDVTAGTWAAFDIALPAVGTVLTVPVTLRPTDGLY